MSSDPPPEDIQQRMEAVRTSLDFDVEQVALSVREKTDWRYYIRSYPWLSLAAAATVGYLLVPRKEKRVVADADALAQLAKQEKLYVTQQSHVKPDKNSWMNQILALALAAGSRTAVTYVSNLVNQSMEKRAKEDDLSSQSTDRAYAGSRPK